MSPIQLKVEVDHAPDFADDVVNILNSVLAAHSTPVEAAKALDSLCTEESDPATFLSLFWELFHPLARQIPYDSQDQDLFAAVVQALDELSPRTVTFKAGWGETFDHAGPLWGNLRESVAAHFYDTFSDCKFCSSTRNAANSVVCKLILLLRAKNTESSGSSISTPLRQELHLYSIFPPRCTFSGLWSTD